MATVIYAPFVVLIVFAVSGLLSIWLGSWLGKRARNR